MSDIRIYGKIANLQFTHIEGGAHCWCEGNVPKTLSALRDDLAKRIKWYRRWPDNPRCAYYRDVPMIAGEEVTYVDRRKRTRSVLARLSIAYWALRNVHWWLDEHLVPDRPTPEKSDFLELSAKYDQTNITWEEWLQSDHGIDKQRTDALNRAEEEAERQLSKLLIWLESKGGAQSEWEFGPGWFRHGDRTCELGGRRLQLLEAFVKARQNSLTHDRITEVSSDEYGERPAYNYVSELNQSLTKLWKMTEKPIRPISGQKAYRFFPPQPTYGKS